MKRLCLVWLLGGTVLFAAPVRADEIPLTESFRASSTEDQAFSFGGHDEAFKAAQSSLTLTTSITDCNAPHLSWSPPISLFSIEFGRQGIATNQADPVAAAQSLFSLGRITNDLISIPEPATITLLSLGLGLIGAKLSRTRTKF